MRYFFEISYTGTHYHGWQSQANAVGVQQVVEDVFKKLFRAKIGIVGSGRTDTGVHCAKQFFHADFARELDRPVTLQKLNSFLPKAISINAIRKVKPDAHARYSAVERAYEYKITRVKNPFYQGFAYHFFKPIDVQAMNEAARNGKKWSGYKGDVEIYCGGWNCRHGWRWVGNSALLRMRPDLEVIKGTKKLRPKVGVPPQPRNTGCAKVKKGRA